MKKCQKYGWLVALFLLIPMHTFAQIEEELSPTEEMPTLPTPQPILPQQDWIIKTGGSVTHFVLFNSNPLYTAPSRFWMETTAIINANFEYQKILAIRSSLMGIRTSGQDPFGNNSDANPLPAFDIDEAYIKYKPFPNWPLTATLGRQHILIGDQFIIGDPIFDGFQKVKQGVFSAPRRGFDALRLESELAGFRLDGVGFFVDPSWDAAGKRDGLFGGIDISRDVDEIAGSYGLGLFYRADGENDDNDMGVFSLRANQHVPPVPGELTLSGEFIYETGRCNHAFYCTNPGNQVLNEFGWHAEVNYKIPWLPGLPFVEAGYAYFSKDYHPVFPGFATWGRWYMGNQTPWVNLNTNEKVIRGQIGFSPLPNLTARLMYFNTKLIDGISEPLSHEFDLAIDWYPNEWLWFSVLMGYAHGTSALTANNLTNPFTNSPVGSNDSIDLVVATGVSF